MSTAAIVPRKIRGRLYWSVGSVAYTSYAEACMALKQTSANVDDDIQQGIDWWNGLSEDTRRYWLRCASSARPVDAWTVYRASVAATIEQHQTDAWDATQAEHGSAEPWPSRSALVAVAELLDRAEFMDDDDYEQAQRIAARLMQQGGAA